MLTTGGGHLWPRQKTSVDYGKGPFLAPYRRLQIVIKQLTILGSSVLLE